MEPTTIEGQGKAQGFGDVLKGAPLDAGAEVTKAKEPEAAAPVVETKPGTEGAPAPVVAAAEPVEAASAVPPKNPHAGLLKGITSERGKRQAAERERDEARAMLAQLQGGAFEPPVQAAPPEDTSRLSQRLLAISEQSARAAHPDYAEKFAAFAEAAFDPETGEPTVLYRTVIDGSDHPGEAAYEAGKTRLLQKKYGTDLDGMVKAIRTEAETEMKERLRAEVTAELTGKIVTKDRTPTDILATGAGGGTDTMPAPLGFSQVLARGTRRR